MSVRVNRPLGLEPCDARGFVLVGVVMLVLALTILGLSLFSLSSYESQFLRASLDRRQAFDCAQGGLERAKYVLAVSGLLERVGELPPVENVIEADAMQVQHGDSLHAGSIDWNGDDVLIRITAGYRGARRTVEARFQPQGARSYYKRLITVVNSITVNIDESGALPEPVNARDSTVDLTGGFWQPVQTAADTSWTDNVYSYLPKGILDRGVPVPDVTSFIAAHQSGALPATLSGPSPRTLQLTGSTGDIGYFYSIDAGPNYSLQDPGSVRIEVDGPVVWLLDRGVRIELPVIVERAGATPNPCLVIVAGRNGRDTEDLDAGIWFWGGLTSHDVPVILVSDGGVRNEQVNTPLILTSVPALSMYGRSVYLTGPDNSAPGSPHMTLAYGGSAMSALIDFLAQHDALPNTSAAMGALALRPGTWRETAR